MKLLPLVVLLSLITSCSMAPIHEEKTASTNGKDKFTLDGGYSPYMYGKGTYGLTKDLDVSVAIESQFFFVFSASAKYSIINNNDGFSLASYTGGFYGHDAVSTKGAYLGLIASHKISWFEPYLAARGNYVKWNGIDELSAEDRDDLFFDFVNNTTRAEFLYLQGTLGFNFWVDKEVAISINGKYIHYVDSSISDGGIILPGIGVLIRL